MLRLHTDDFSTMLNRDFRLQLIENFKLLENYCNGGNGFEEKLKSYITKKELEDTLAKNATKQDIADLKAMIQRVTLGTDEPTIEAKVEAALKERGL